MSSMPTVQELRAFVGESSADYYIQAWGPALDGRGRAGGFNIAAFFFTVTWLLYRKMYRVSLLVCGLALAEVALEAAVLRAFRRTERAAEALGGVSCFASLVFVVVVGTYGNAWYLGHARRVIAEVRARRLPEEQHLKALAWRGGTSLTAALVLSVAFTLLLRYLTWALGL